MNRTTVTAMIARHEGRRLKPYTDTAGKLTIGYGRNLTDDGIVIDEAKFMLDNDVTTAIKECYAVQCFGSLDDDRQHVLIDMMFNLGPVKLLKFTKMLAAIEARDFKTAATEMMNSAWAIEVGQRAIELAALMRGPEGETT
jgi:lysozyme